MVLKTKLNGKNKIQAINTWAVAILRYGGGILDWKTEELKAMDRRSRKFLAMYGALHPKSDVDRLYIPRKKGGRGLAGCEKSVKAEVNSIGWYIHNSDEPLLQEVQEKEIVEARDCVSKNEYRRRDLDQSEEKWRNKKMYGQYVREVSESADEGKTWRWLSKCDLKPETEALICAAQEQAIRTNYVKCNIDKSVASPLCRLCHEKGESISHVVSECKKLAQSEYKKRHDNVAKYIHWELLGQFLMERSEKWYEHKPVGVMERNGVTVMWDFMVQCDRYIEHRKPDILIIDSLQRRGWIIDVAIPGDSRVTKKEEEKVNKYQDLRLEIVRLWKLKKVDIIPVVVGALGAVSRSIESWLEKLGVVVRVEHIQKTALLGTANIIRQTLQ